MFKNYYDNDDDNNNNHHNTINNNDNNHDNHNKTTMKWRRIFVRQNLIFNFSYAITVVSVLLVKFFISPYLLETL